MFCYSSFSSIRILSANYPHTPRILLPTSLHTCSYLIAYSFLPHFILVPTSLHTRSYLIAYSFLPHCILCPTSLHTRSYLIAYSFLPRCILVPTSLHTRYTIYNMRSPSKEQSPGGQKFSTE